MIPFRDANPTKSPPVVTISIIVINVLVYLYEWSLNGLEQLAPFFDQWALIPHQLVTHFSTEVVTIFTAMFLHGSWMHLGGNMLYLWIFGDNIEDRMGRGRFVIFYILCGVCATIAQVAIDPSSNVPNVGASGAIAGVLGAYLLLYPKAPITTLVVRFITTVPAYLVLGFWFVLQLFQGVGSLSTVGEQMGGVAFFAHVGGFVAGFLLVKLFLIGKDPRRMPIANQYLP